MNGSSVRTPGATLKSPRDEVLLGKCLVVLKNIPDESVDAVVTDPPYGLGTKNPSVAQIVVYLQGADLDTGGDFMGSKWTIPSVLVWREVYRVLKPGAHVACFGGTRTWDLISLGARAAGFEFRDSIAAQFPALQWIHGQGFPKSLNVSKAIDKQVGAEPVRTGRPKQGHEKYFGTDSTGHAKGWDRPWMHDPEASARYHEATEPSSPEAKHWSGYGTGLKPAWEPILVFRKPFAGTVADNVREHGTGALNIDATRVGTGEDKGVWPVTERHGRTSFNSAADGSLNKPVETDTTKGRWPSNMTLSHAPGCKRVGVKKVRGIPVRDGETRPGNHAMTPGGGGARPNVGETPIQRYADADGLETVDEWRCVEGCPVKALDEQSEAAGVHGAGHAQDRPMGEGHEYDPKLMPLAACARGPRRMNRFGDSGGASRFFPSFPGQEPVEIPFFYTSKVSKREATLNGQIENKHPTKKPLGLMKWLVRLVCRKGGVVLDPYCGSGTTLHAACEEGMYYIGIDENPDYVELSRKRMAIVGQQEGERRSSMNAFDLAMELGEEGSDE